MTFRSDNPAIDHERIVAAIGAAVAGHESEQAGSRGFSLDSGAEQLDEVLFAAGDHTAAEQTQGHQERRSQADGIPADVTGEAPPADLSWAFQLPSSTARCRRSMRCHQYQ